MREKYEATERFYEGVWDTWCSFIVVVLSAAISYLSTLSERIKENFGLNLFFSCGAGILVVVGVYILSRRVRKRATIKGQRLAYIAAVDALETGKLRETEIMPE